MKNQAGEGEVGVLGEGMACVGEGFVSVNGHEKARRVRDRAGWEAQVYGSQRAGDLRVMWPTGLLAGGLALCQFEIGIESIQD